MRQIIFHLLLVIGLITVAACAKCERVGPDYVLVTPETLNMDGHPGTALYFKGKEVWSNVYGGYGKYYHDGIFVFSAPVPATFTNQDGIYMYDYSISPQLFAVRNAEPPVILSQRIIGEILESEKRYRLWQITPIENGIRVEYKSDIGQQAHMTRDVSWKNIQSWVQEADASAPTEVRHLGVYRVLPVGSPTR